MTGKSALKTWSKQYRTTVTLTIKYIRSIEMIRDRSVDLLILFLNVVAILVLVAILSVMMNTANAKNQSASTDHTNLELIATNTRA